MTCASGHADVCIQDTPEVATPVDLSGTANVLPASRLRRVTTYIDEHLDTDLRIAVLSAVVHMSPFHFARLFKRSTGVSPHQFVVRRRVELARDLLALQTVAIADIARIVGFRTPSHFTTTFRRIAGVTPSQYRSTTERATP